MDYRFYSKAMWKYVAPFQFKCFSSSINAFPAIFKFVVLDSSAKPFSSKMTKIFEDRSFLHDFPLITRCRNFVFAWNLLWVTHNVFFIQLAVECEIYWQDWKTWVESLRLWSNFFNISKFLPNIHWLRSRLQMDQHEKLVNFGFCGDFLLKGKASVV